MKTIIILIVILALANSRTYTHFQQCDASWSRDKLGTGTNTICSSGSLITSVAMILNTYGIKVHSTTSNPHTLNVWLNQNGGYISRDLFLWNSLESLGFVYQGQVNPQSAKDSFNSGNHVILNVRNGAHFVLMTGLNNDDEYFVNDPAYKDKQYSLNQIQYGAVYSHQQINYFKHHILMLK